MKHKNNSKAVNVDIQPKITQTPLAMSENDAKEKKIAEIRFAANIAMHSPIMAADHFGEILKNNICTEKGCKNKLKDFSVHRTKCSKLIRNVFYKQTNFNSCKLFIKVIAKDISTQLKEDLKDMPYSILIDEWSDVHIKPHLGVVALYFSNEGNEMRTRFLGLVELISVDATGIFNQLEALMEQYELKFSNMIGYGSDGANVVSGQNNSVWTRIKEKNPNCIQFTCICHSLNKVADEAFNEMPSQISACLSLIPKWFKKSEKRKIEYMKLFTDLNEDISRSDCPFETYSQTRWLSRGSVMKKIISNWSTLLTYFESILPEMKNDQRFKVNLIIDMLRNNEFKKLFVFTYPIIKLLEDKNKLFQASYMDPLTVVEEISFLLKSFELRIFDQSGNLKNFEDVDFGFEFLNLCPNPETKVRAFNYLRKIYAELLKRTSNSNQKIKHISFIKPSLVVNLKTKPKFESLPMNSFKTSKAEQQYRLIQEFPWHTLCDKPINDMNPIEFYTIVASKENYKSIAKYLISILTLPVSNASTERIFSIAGSIKTKVRNRMIIGSLDAIIRIRDCFNVTKQCCYTFEIRESMLSLVNLSMYTD